MIDIVSPPKRDWEGLARKIRAGIPIREAAKVCGIPEPELLEYISKQLLKPAEISYEMQRMAEVAMKTGIDKLTEITKEGPRYSAPASTVVSSDLLAAQTLAKLGLEILKLSLTQNPEAKVSNGKVAGATLKLDLWDNSGAWELKKPGAD